MVRDSRNIIPVSMAILLHAALFGSMIVAFEYSRPTPFTPLAIQATLVAEVPESRPPPPIVEPEPEPEPEPIIEEPEPEPDNSEELRRQAEEEKRQLDALLEQQRLEKLKQQEEERKRKAEEEAERKKREEAELERKRIEAEKKREEEVRRQREENERERLEFEAEQRQAEIDAESRRFEARNSAEMAAYQYAIGQKIRRNWSVPGSAPSETRCTVRVTQLPTGDVVAIKIDSCNGDGAVVRSIEAAIQKSSPLPKPSNPDLFDRNLTLNLSFDRDY